MEREDKVIMNNTNISYTSKRKIRRNYKKPKTKQQMQADKKERVFKRLRDCKVNCGEDKVLQSYHARYKDYIITRKELERSKWQGIDRTLLEGSLILNGVAAIPNPNGCKDWPKSRQKYKYKYLFNGIEIGISNGDRPTKLEYDTIPNIISKMGPEALAYDLVIANNFLNKSLGSFVDKFWSNWLTRVDAHIDVPIPFDRFYKYYQNGMYDGQIGRKKAKHREYGTAHQTGTKVIIENETVHVNINGDIDIVIYDKIKELLQDKSGKKLELYLRKFGELPEHLTRIEMRLKRGYLKKAGKGGMYGIKSVGAWQCFKASIIDEIMTIKFRFVEEDGSTMPEWDWARHKYMEWAKVDVSKHPTEHVSTKCKVKTKSFNYVQSLKKGLGTIRTAMIKKENKLIESPEQFINEVMKIINDPKLKEQIFTNEFFQKCESTFHKEKSQYDTSDILESIYSEKGILNSL